MSAVDYQDREHITSIHKMLAIKKLLAVYGVTDSMKIVAIRCIVNGAPPEKVVEAIQDASLGLASLEALRIRTLPGAVETNDK
jgi:hypothetical protein